MVMRKKAYTIANEPSHFLLEPYVDKLLPAPKFQERIFALVEVAEDVVCAALVKTDRFVRRQSGRKGQSSD